MFDGSLAVHAMRSNRRSPRGSLSNLMLQIGVLRRNVSYITQAWCFWPLKWWLWQGKAEAAVVPSDRRGTLLCADRFDGDGMLRLKGRRLEGTTTAPLPSLFWAAGFSFSRKHLLQEVRLLHTAGLAQNHALCIWHLLVWCRTGKT